MLYHINSGTYEPEGSESFVKKDVLQKDKALETAFYLGDEWEITPKLSVNAGIRYSLFSALGPRSVSYTHLPNFIQRGIIHSSQHFGQNR